VAGHQLRRRQQVRPSRRDGLLVLARQKPFQPQQQLQVGVQDVAVDLNRRARQPPPHRGRQGRHRLEGIALHRLQGGPQQRVQSSVHKE
jgi:hypothetical protein